MSNDLEPLATYDEALVSYVSEDGEHRESENEVKIYPNWVVLFGELWVPRERVKSVYHEKYS